MKYGDATMGQFEAVINKLGGMNGLQQFLSGEIVVGKPPKPTVLKFCKEITVGPLKERFVPTDFFKTREGLYLWNDMRRVLKNAQEVDPTGTAETKLRSFDLVKNVYDHEIKADLPENHEVELWQIAELIEKQKDGKTGSLLTNGYANIFYIADYAVFVSWDAVCREWDVHAWSLDGVRWGGDYRVFSRN